MGLKAKRVRISDAGSLSRAPENLRQLDVQGVDGRVSLLIECRYKSATLLDGARPPQTTDQSGFSSGPFPLGTPFVFNKLEILASTQAASGKQEVSMSASFEAQPRRAPGESNLA